VAVLFEGASRAVDEQLGAAERLVRDFGTASTEDGDVWRQSRSRQGDAQGRVRFEPGRLGETLDALTEAVVRPAAGVAYVPEAVREEADEGVRRLTEALQRALDAQRVLSG
jgi:hypothetical protein